MKTQLPKNNLHFLHDNHKPILKLTLQAILQYNQSCITRLNPNADLVKVIHSETQNVDNFGAPEGFNSG